MFIRDQHLEKETGNWGLSKGRNHTLLTPNGQCLLELAHEKQRLDPILLPQTLIVCFLGERVTLANS